MSPVQYSVECFGNAVERRVRMSCEAMQCDCDVRAGVAADVRAGERADGGAHAAGGR